MPFRQIRERLKDLEDQFDRLPTDRPNHDGLMLGKVISDVTSGSAASGIYIGVRPVKIKGPQGEGLPATFTTLDQDISVLLLGKQTVNAGDLVICMQAGNVWVVPPQRHVPTGGGPGCLCTSVPSSLVFDRVTSGPYGPYFPLLGTTAPPWTFTYQPTPALISGRICNTSSLFSDTIYIDMPTDGWFFGPEDVSAFLGSPPGSAFGYGYLYFQSCAAHIAPIFYATAGPMTNLSGRGGAIVSPPPTCVAAMIGSQMLVLPLNPVPIVGQPPYVNTCSPFDILVTWYNEFSSSNPGPGTLTGTGTTIPLTGFGNAGQPSVPAWPASYP